MKKILGELFERTSLSMSRLLEKEYAPPLMYTYSSDWPGDFIGRNLLAACSLYEASEGYEEERNTIMDRIRYIRENLNPNIYFYQGPLFDFKTVDEQQVSGNSWYIRGLIKYYKITKDESVIKELKSIIDNFILKIPPFYDTYPLDKRKRGEVSGSLTGEITSGWKTSTDIGCAFIMTDGVTDLYELLKDERLVPLIKKMIDLFSNADFVGLNFQTHATLTFTRAVYRFYKTTNDKKYFDISKRILDLYLKEGTTLDLSNINWFNRSDSWTEPCAIIDSIILLKNFYLETKDEKYLKLFNKVYINSLRTFQRINGGAGCSLCATKEKPIMKPFIYEAFFCCSMRLPEGLSEIFSFSSFIEDDTIIIPLNAKISLEDEYNSIYIDNEIYKNDRIHIEVIKTNYKRIMIYVPEFSNLKSYERQGSFILLDIKNGLNKDIDIDLLIERDGNVLRCGDMLLSKKEKHIDRTFVIGGDIYSYIYNNSKFKKEELENASESLL